MKHSSVTLSIVLIPTIATLALAQPAIHLLSQQYDFWYGSNTPAIVGDIAYVPTVYSGLRIMDLSDPVSPEPVNALYLDAPIYSAIAEGDLLLTLSSDTAATLSLWNIEDRAHPRFCSNIEIAREEWEDPFYPYRMAISDRLICLLDWNCFVIVDALDPEQPREVARFNTLFAFDLAVRNGYAYLTNNLEFPVEAFQIYDLSSLEPAGSVQCEGAFGDFVVNDNYAYIQYHANRNSLIQLIDISDPGNPTILEQLPENIWQGRALLANNDLVITSSRDTLSLYTIDDPFNPAKVGEIKLPGFQIEPTFINDHLLSLPGSGTQLATLDISDWEEPAILGVYPPPGHVNDVVVSGPYAYVAAYAGGLDIWNIADPVSPEMLSHLDYDTLLYEILSYRDVLFFSANRRGLLIADVSDPGQPRLVDPGDSVYVGAMALHEDMLVTPGRSPGGMRYGVRILDISEPLQPQHVGRLGVDNEPKGFAFWDNYFVVVDGYFMDWNIDGGNIYTFDISDPANPVEISRLETTYLFRDVVVRDGVAFAGWISGIDGFSEGINGVLAFSISDEGQLGELSNTRMRSYVEDLELVGDRLVVSEYRCGFSIWDVSDPATPEKVLEQRTPGLVQNFDYRNGIIYLADWTNFGIYDASEALGVQREVIPKPSSMDLSVFPNPFNSSTTISFSLSKPGRYAVDVVDLSGRLVARLFDGWREAGSYREVFEGNGLTTGNYFLRIENGNNKISRAITLIK